MLLRRAISRPPGWQVAASVALMLATGLLAVRAAKAHRAGILMSSKRVTLSELVRWLRDA